MQDPKLDLLPAHNENNGIDVEFIMETINYEHGSTLDEYGDREIIDVSRQYFIRSQVPKISFVDWIETLCSLRNHSVSTTHCYTRKIVPYENGSPHFWGYFDQVEGNLITNGVTFGGQTKVRIYMYFIEDFNYFALLRLHSHHDIVKFRL